MAIVQNKGTTELYHYGTPRHSGRYPYHSGYNPRAYLEDVDMTLAEYHGLDKKPREEEEAKRKVAEGIKALKRYDEMDEATPFAANKYITKKLRAKIQNASVEELQKMLDTMHKEADNGHNSFRKKDYDDIEAEISRETVGRAIRANIRIKNGDWTVGKDDGSIGYHLRNMVHSYYKTGEPYDLSSAKKSYPKMSNVQLRTAIDDVVTRRNAYIPYLMKYGYSSTEAKRTVSALTDALMTEARSRNLMVSKTGNIVSHIPGTKLNQVAKDMKNINGGENANETYVNRNEIDKFTAKRLGLPDNVRRLKTKDMIENDTEYIAKKYKSYSDEQLKRRLDNLGYDGKTWPVTVGLHKAEMNDINTELTRRALLKQTSQNKVKHEDDSDDLYQEGKPKRSGRYPYKSGYNPRAWLRDHDMTLAEYHGRDGNRHGGKDRDNRNEHHDNRHGNDHEHGRPEHENERKDNQPKEETRELTWREKRAEKKAAKKAEAERKEKERIVRSGSVKKVKKNLEKLTNRELEDAIQRAKLVKDLKRIKRDSRVIGIAERMDRTAGMLKSGIKLYNLSADIQNAFNAHREKDDRKKDWVHVGIFKTKDDKDGKKDGSKRSKPQNGGN